MKLNFHKITRLLILLLLVVSITLQSCRKDKQPILSEDESLFPGDLSASPKGLYLLNEGNMNANKASLDYLDFTTGIYHRNIYDEVKAWEMWEMIWPFMDLNCISCLITQIK